MAPTISNEWLLVIILATIVVVVIVGLRVIAIVQKKNEALTSVLMILVVLAVGFLDRSDSALGDIEMKGSWLRPISC